MNVAEDGVFAAFCRKIKVINIREYEERQLKLAQEESQARLRFDTQIARLTNQCVGYRLLFSITHQAIDRADFENEGLRYSEDRLTQLESIIGAEQINLDKLEEEKTKHARDIEALEANILSQETERQSLQENLDEKSKELDAAKKAASKVSKVSDQTMKEIAACVSSFLECFC